jgi:predicted fused transcriptional regulator/phosphomethylpyrimidine kinase
MIGQILSNNNEKCYSTFSPTFREVNTARQQARRASQCSSALPRLQMNVAVALPTTTRDGFRSVRLPAGVLATV